MCTDLKMQTLAVHLFGLDCEVAHRKRYKRKRIWLDSCEFTWPYFTIHDLCQTVSVRCRDSSVHSLIQGNSGQVHWCVPPHLPVNLSLPCAAQSQSLHIHIDCLSAVSQYMANVYDQRHVLSWTNYHLTADTLVDGIVSWQPGHASVCGGFRLASSRSYSWTELIVVERTVENCNCHSLVLHTIR